MSPADAIAATASTEGERNGRHDEHSTDGGIDPARVAVAFTRVLRGAGLSVPASCTHTFAEALCAVGMDERTTVYWAGRTTLARRPE
ncbi:MAG: hypothetical protein AAGG08_11835, partial [Actinomycetota bacterium]